MGSKSASKSKSSSSNTTTTTNRTDTLNSAISGDIEEGAVAVSGRVNDLGSGNRLTIGKGAKAKVEVIDGGAFDLVGQVVQGVGGFLTQLNETQAEVLGAANSLAGTAVSNATAGSGVEPVEVSKVKHISYAAAFVVSVLGGFFIYLSKRKGR